MVFWGFPDWDAWEPFYNYLMNLTLKDTMPHAETLKDNCRRYGGDFLLL